MAKSFPNFMKNINTKIQEAESSSSTINNVREHYNLETIAEKKLKKTYIHQREIPYSWHARLKILKNLLSIN